MNNGGSILEENRNKFITFSRKFKYGIIPTRKKSYNDKNWNELTHTCESGGKIQNEWWVKNVTW